MFKSTSKLIFMSVEDKVSQKGKPFRIVHVADPATYERLEFFANDNIVVEAKENQMCVVELQARKQGYATAMNCLSVMPMS